MDGSTGIAPGPFDVTAKRRREGAADYVKIAKIAIMMAKEPDDLRFWWKEEEKHREEFQLSEEQIEDLVKACGIKVQALGGEIRKREEMRRKFSKKRKKLI
jgi:hypothetical protein